MKKNKQLKQTAKEIHDGIISAASISVNDDGSLNVVKEPCSKYSFIVRFVSEDKLNILLTKLYELGYLIDLETKHGYSKHFPDSLLKIDVANKIVNKPLIVSVNHFIYLNEIDSILLDDVINSFDELVINQNKSLAYSLRQNSQESKNYLDSQYKRSDK